MFPSELIEYVFGLLQERCQEYDDVEAYHTLKACTLDPLLSPFAARYLCANLTLYDGESNLNTTRTFPNSLCTSLFSKLFSVNPYIADYVRDLRIVFDKVLPDEQWETILRKLQRLESIAIVGPNISGVTWTTIPKGFRDVFLACVDQPAVTKISFVNVFGFPLHILENCKISNLLLRNSACVLYEAFLQRTALSPDSFLKSLTLDRVMFKSALGPLDDMIIMKRYTHRLHSLSFAPGRDDDVYFLSSLLSTCSDTLVCLHIDLLIAFWTGYNLDRRMIYPPHHSIPLSLSILSHLERLEIGAQVLMVGDSYGTFRKNYSSLPHICRLLRSSPQYITHPILRLRINYKTPNWLSTIDWLPLVSLFETTSHSIEQVILNIHVEQCRYFSENQARSELLNSTNLMRLVEEGLVVLETSVTEEKVDFHL